MTSLEELKAWLWAESEPTASIRIYLDWASTRSCFLLSVLKRSQLLALEQKRTRRRTLLSSR